MTMAGCYTLDLYCDNVGTYNLRDTAGRLVDGFGHFYDEFPHQYTNEIGSKCRSMARKAGWMIRKEKQLCPKCSKRCLWKRN